MPTLSNPDRQLQPNAIISAFQMVIISKEGLTAFRRLGQTAAPVNPTTELMVTSKSVRFLAQNYHIQMTEKSDSSFIDVDLSKKSLTELSEPTLDFSDKAATEQPISNSSFVEIPDNAPHTILTDLEIRALAEKIRITLPGLEDTGFVPGALLITDLKARLLALPSPLLHNDPTSLDEEEKRIVNALNEWHIANRTDAKNNLALAETAYFHDIENDRLVIRHRALDATGKEKPKANQHISNVTEEIISRLRLQKMGMQIHHCIPWVEIGWSSPHIRLRTKTENFVDDGTTEENFFDSRWNFSAFSGDQTTHTMKVQSIWNWDDCGRYVTLGTTVGAFILSKRGKNRATLTDADLVPYLPYIKSAEECDDVKALRERLLKFRNLNPVELSPTQQSPTTTQSSDAVDELDGVTNRALTKMSFLVRGAAYAARDAYQGMRGGMALRK